MNYWTLTPPTKWQAGTTGAARVPFYFSCADCNAPDVPIAGILSEDGTYTGIGLLRGVDAFVRPAMFCVPCFEKRITAPSAAAPPPADVERAYPGDPHHADDL